MHLQATKKVLNLSFKTCLTWRYLAESNCSTRFCRPLPNRSAKVPLLNCECKGSDIFFIHQIFLHINLIFFIFMLQFFLSSHFLSAIMCLITTFLILRQRASRTRGTRWIFATSGYRQPYSVSDIRYRKKQNNIYNQQLCHIYKAIRKESR